MRALNCILPILSAKHLIFGMYFPKKIGIFPRFIIVQHSSGWHRAHCTSHHGSCILFPLFIRVMDGFECWRTTFLLHFISYNSSLSLFLFQFHFCANRTLFLHAGESVCMFVLLNEIPLISYRISSWSGFFVRCFVFNTPLLCHHVSLNSLHLFSAFVLFMRSHVVFFSITVLRFMSPVLGFDSWLLLSN